MLPEHRLIEIQTDNINSQLLLSKKGGKSANRWLTLRWFFVKDAVAQGHVEIHRVDTKKNIADGFTKALAKDQCEVFAKLIGMSYTHMKTQSFTMYARFGGFDRRRHAGSMRGMLDALMPQASHVYRTP